MPKWLRVSIAVICIVVACAPLVIAPEFAESYGWSRSDGSTLGALITVALFAIIGAVSVRIIRRQAKREVGREIDRLLAPHRDDDQGTDRK